MSVISFFDSRPAVSFSVTRACFASMLTRVAEDMPSRSTLSVCLPASRSPAKGLGRVPVASQL